MKRSFLILSLLGVAAFAADKPQPKLTLTLRLAKTRWHIGEYLWYRAEVRNNDKSSAVIDDGFWSSHVLLKPEPGTHFTTRLEVMDSKHRPVDWRREQYLNDPEWVDDLSGRGSAAKGALRLDPGQVYATAATVLRWHDTPSSSTPKAVLTASTWSSWRPAESPPGFRILPWDWISQPGHYTARVRMDEAGAISDPVEFEVVPDAAEEISDRPLPKLDLQLRLSKKRWRLGEYLWYRLQIRNDGKDEFKTPDDFWFDHWALIGNEWSGWGTYLQLFDQEGRPVPIDDMKISRARPPTRDCFWMDETDDLPRAPDFAHDIVIAPGKAITASPTRLRCRKEARGSALSVLDFMDSPSKKEAVTPAPHGFRIWDGYTIARPGRYKIIAVLDEMPELLPTRWELGTEEHMRRLSDKERSRLERARDSRGHAVSNMVEFEVTP